MELAKRVAKRLASIARINYTNGIVDVRDIDYREFCNIVCTLTQLGFKIDLRSITGFMIVKKTNATANVPTDVYKLYYMLNPTQEQYYSTVIATEGAALRC